MKSTIQDRGYFSAGSIERIEYADGETAKNPVYAKIDTHLGCAEPCEAPMYTCFVEALWVEENGSVRVRREPAERMKIILRKPEQPTG